MYRDFTKNTCDNNTGITVVRLFDREFQYFLVDILSLFFIKNIAYSQLFKYECDVTSFLNVSSNQHIIACVYVTID